MGSNWNGKIFKICLFGFAYIRKTDRLNYLTNHTKKLSLLFRAFTLVCV